MNPDYAHGRHLSAVSRSLRAFLCLSSKQKKNSLKCASFSFVDFVFIRYKMVTICWIVIRWFGMKRTNRTYHTSYGHLYGNWKRFILFTLTVHFILSSSILNCYAFSLACLYCIYKYFSSGVFKSDLVFSSYFQMWFHFVIFSCIPKLSMWKAESTARKIEKRLIFNELIIAARSKSATQKNNDCQHFE